jgi:response regulator of citrate/malate metabolism
MADWRVLIVEDDPTVAKVHRRIVAGHPGMAVVGMAASAEQALQLVRSGLAIDLILLDVSLPGADGTALLRALRARKGPEVIAVTASRDPKIVQSMLQLGIIDYLVKPFEVERLQQALLRFRDRMRALSIGDLEQREIDELCARAPRRLLPKGLQPDTLELIRTTVRQASPGWLSAEQVAADTAVARVTARRYLEYLTTMNQVDCEAECDGPGRPRKLYQWRRHHV